MAGALETVWSIMARLGPEDALAAVPLPRNSSSFATAGNDWAIVKQKVDESAFHYKDAAEAQRLAAIVESDRCAVAHARALVGLNGQRVSLPCCAPYPPSGSQDNRILRDLASTRYLCAQPSFALEVRRWSGVRAMPPRMSPHTVCTFSLPQLCQRSFRAHQLKQCTPVYVEHLKCSVKLCVRRGRGEGGGSAHTLDSLPHPLPSARAVDILCRPQYTSLTTCLRGAGGDASQCIPQVTAFDTCTESF